jgi:hypothetical protein
MAPEKELVNPALRWRASLASKSATPGGFEVAVVAGCPEHATWMECRGQSPGGGASGR